VDHLFGKDGEIRRAARVPGSRAGDGEGSDWPQKRYFEELRAEVKKGIDAGKKLDEITSALDLRGTRNGPASPRGRTATTWRTSTRS